jgi:hypothetical protein
METTKEFAGSGPCSSSIGTTDGCTSLGDKLGEVDTLGDGALLAKNRDLRLSWYRYSFPTLAQDV